jgi:chlorophyllase
VSLESGFVLSAHSAGGKVITWMLEESCSNATAAVLLDPVDGEDPWGIIPSFAIHPPYPVNTTLPMLVVGSGLGPVPAAKLVPACTPRGMNFPRFYDAFQCPKWLLNATAFGHADFLDAEFRVLIKDAHICTVGDGNEQVFELYQDFVAGTVIAFTQGTLTV